MTSLEMQLETLGYQELFQRLTSDNLDALWNQAGMPEQLAALVLDQSASAQARFLAAEILFHRQPGYPPETIHAELARVYAAALSQAEIGNQWGLPEELDGLSGQHFVQLGEAAIPSLQSLLDDERPVAYEGSKEATYGNSYQYRVKDFAAFYISEIRGLPYEVDMDPELRNAEIYKLKTAL